MAIISHNKSGDSPRTYSDNLGRRDFIDDQRRDNSLYGAEKLPAVGIPGAERSAAGGRRFRFCNLVGADGKKEILSAPVKTNTGCRG